MPGNGTGKGSGMTDIRISICDLNPLFVAEAHRHLMDLPNVFEVAHRSVLDRPVDAVVSPANSFGFMDGGVDWAYLQFFGEELQTRVQTVIRLQRFQELLVGDAIVVPTYNEAIRFLIVAPTMRVPKIIGDPADVMLATRAALRMACNFRFDHIAMPGLGTGCGQVRPDVAARAMRAGIEAGLRDTPRRPYSWREAQERHFQLRG
jgi:O-acetyl-ADP-ribose deacetylase (regulator of RNase III)